MEKLKRIKKNFKKNWFFYLLPLPGLIYMILFNYAPLAGLYMVFERYTYAGGLFGSEFVGLENFRAFFQNSQLVLRALRNTVVLNVLNLVVGTIADVAFAIVMAEILNKGYKKIVQSVTMFPNFISWIVVGALSISLFHEQNGLFNRMLTSLGADPVAWYSNPWYWWPILIITTLWKGVGYGSLVHYSALMGVDRGLYEAAAIDGASRIKRIWYISLPQLTPSIIIMFLMGLGNVLRGSMEPIMGMTSLNPTLFETTDTMAVFIYRMAITGGRFETASAMGLLQSIFGMLLVIIANTTVRKIEPDYSLF